MPIPALSLTRVGKQAKTVPDPLDSNEQDVWAGHAADHAVIHQYINLLFTGTGSPEGVVTAAMGSLFLRTDGGAATTLYVKTSGAGNTGWTAK